MFKRSPYTFFVYGVSKQQNGFTLIELLITLTLIGIISMISLQGLQHLKQHSDDEIASLKLIKLLQYAKQESLLRRADISVNFAAENITVLTDYNQELKSIKLNGKLFWRAYPNYQDHIVFHSSGEKLSDNATCWYCHRNSQSPVWAVTVSRDGRISKVLPNRFGAIRDSHGKVLDCNRAATNRSGQSNARR